MLERGDRVPDRETRFRLAVQKNRAVVYTTACSLGILSDILGYYEVTVFDVVFVVAIGVVSAAIVWLASRLGLHKKPGMGAVFDWIWLFADMFAISAAIYMTGGIDSIWFPWYLVNISAAAFVMSQRAAAIIALLDTAAFVIVLVLLGHITGFGEVLFRTVAWMVNLYAASYFFLRAVAALQKRTRQVNELREIDQARVAELAETNLRLVEADKTKSRFLANMSHELRTPLNAIIGFSEILMQRTSDRDERLIGFLRNIHTSGKHLLSLISDILDLSKVEAGKMELFPEETNVDDLVSDVCEIVRGTANDRGVEIVRDVPEDLPAIDADPIRVKQILFNLLSNAIKFSPSGEAVAVVARHVPSSSSPIGLDSIRFAVADDGPGLSETDQEHIFEEFRQATSADPTQRTGGTGLGLALVKRFVDLHGGHVEVASRLGEGTTFTVTLPVAFRGKRSGQGPERATGRSTGLVLIVEDDRDDHATIDAALRRAGYSTAWCRNGETVLPEVSRLHPIAIVMDLVLPGIDGFEIMKRLQENEETREIPVVVVSVLPSRELGMELGAAAYIFKPVRGERVVESLEQILENSLARGAAPHTGSEA